MIHLHSAIDIMHAEKEAKELCYKSAEKFAIEEADRRRFTLDNLVKGAQTQPKLIKNLGDYIDCHCCSS